EVLGGSATHFAVAASYFAPVQLVAVVGEDFPDAEREYLAGRGIDLSGLEVRPGRTFRWTGRYHEDLNVRDTLELELNVFAAFRRVQRLARRPTHSRARPAQRARQAGRVRGDPLLPRVGVRGARVSARGGVRPDRRGRHVRRRAHRLSRGDRGAFGRRSPPCD